MDGDIIINSARRLRRFTGNALRLCCGGEYGCWFPFYRWVGVVGVVRRRRAQISLFMVDMMVQDLPVELWAFCVAIEKGGGGWLWCLTTKMVGQAAAGLLLGGLIVG